MSVLARLTGKSGFCVLFGFLDFRVLSVPLSSQFMKRHKILLLLLFLVFITMIVIITDSLQCVVVTIWFCFNPLRFSLVKFCNL